MTSQLAAVYSPAHPNLDRDHRLLFDLLEKVRTAALNSTLLKGYVQEFRAYLDAHFEHEEELMDSYGYPMAAEHKEAHRRMRQKAESLSPVTGEAVRTELIESIEAWIQAHVYREDTGFSDFLKICNVERVTGESGLFNESE